MSKFDHILDRRMSRKEFVATLGLGLVSILGFSTIMGILSGDHKSTGSNAQLGFGIGPYGGEADGKQ